MCFFWAKAMDMFNYFDGLAKGKTKETLERYLFDRGFVTTPRFVIVKTLYLVVYMSDCHQPRPKDIDA